ncbi:MAG: hypothetical protein R2729_20540 [Bryobacteraceae bacterium]
MPRTPILCAATMLAQFVAGETVFVDDFEADRNWVLFEEIVGGNLCYGDGIASLTRSPRQSVSPSRSLLVWANAARTVKANHVIAYHRVASAGRKGRWRYSVRAFVDPATAPHQAGPEYSMQNTRRAPSGAYLTYIGAVQYQASPFLPDYGWWYIWRETAAGRADWVPLAYRPIQTGQWYELALEVDYDANRYISFTVLGNDADSKFFLNDVQIAGVDTFTEETFDITLEAQNLWSNCGDAGVFEARTFYDDVDFGPGRSPSGGTVSPLGGTGARQAFEFRFDASGPAYPIEVANVLINSSLDRRNGCYLAYNRPSNKLYLVSDDGFTLLPGLVLNGAGSVANSLCTVYGSGSSVTGTGNTMVLRLDLGFAQGFGGARTIYTAARDDLGGNSGWHVAGTWQVPPAVEPVLSAALPSPPGEAASNVFRLRYRDTSGQAAFTNVQMLLNRDLDGRAACWVGYDPVGQAIYLVGDDGGTLLPGLPIGSAGSRENYTCRVNGATSSAAIAGADLSVNLDIAFKIPFARRLVYATATKAGAQLDWVPVGTWAVP